MLYKKKKEEQFSSCFWADSAVYLLQKTITTTKNTFKLNNSLRTDLAPRLVMSLDLLEILCGLQHSGQAGTCSVALSWLRAPAASYQQKESIAVVQHIKGFPLHVYFSLFPSVALPAAEKSVSQRTEQWKPGTHWMCVLFASILRAWVLVWGLPRGGDDQETWKPLPHQLSTKKRKSSPKSTSFSPFLCLDFLFLSLYDLFSTSAGAIIIMLYFRG